MPGALDKLAKMIGPQSQVGRMIESATREDALGPDWGLNMQICDLINSGGQAVANDAVYAIKKRMKNRNPKVALLTLDILETGVKNCGVDFHLEVGSLEFLNELEAMVAKNDCERPVRAKVLMLVQSWAEAFSQVRDDMPAFEDLYMRLRRKGFEFPARDMTSMAPVFTSADGSHRSTLANMGDTNEYGQPIASRQMPMSAGGYGGAQTRSQPPPSQSAPAQPSSDSARQTLQSAYNSLELLQSLRASGEGGEFMEEVISQIKSIQGKVSELIPTLSSEEDMMQALTCNDALLAVLEGKTVTVDYGAQANQQQQAPPRQQDPPAYSQHDLLGDMAPPPATNPAARPPPAQPSALEDLMGFGDEAPAANTQPPAATSAPPAQQQQSLVDDFDLLSMSPLPAGSAGNTAQPEVAKQPTAAAAPSNAPPSAGASGASSVPTLAPPPAATNPMSLRLKPPPKARSVAGGGASSSQRQQQKQQKEEDLLFDL